MTTEIQGFNGKVIKSAYFDTINDNAALCLVFSNYDVATIEAHGDALKVRIKYAPSEDGEDK